MTRENFISDLSHWNSYLPLLYKALESTEGDVIELGVGSGSTEKLHNYCNIHNRTLWSYESNLEWYKKFEHLHHKDFPHNVIYVGDNWQIMQENHLDGRTSLPGVLFSDEAPGEMRKYNISMFCNIAKVIVAHDAEQSNDHGYKFSLIKPLFRYYKLHEYPGASTAAFSNFVDVYKWEL